MITDFHAHVLPGADHGCSGGTEAKKQLELAYKAGVD
jgi:tyrosine-protein phosphatase YwqE